MAFHVTQVKYKSFYTVQFNILLLGMRISVLDRMSVYSLFQGLTRFRFKKQNEMKKITREKNPEELKNENSNKKN